MITVFSKPNCSQCIATETFLKQKGLEFEKIDITKDETAMNHVTELGYKQLPVVEVSNENHWSGFRPDKISSLV